MDEGHPDVPIFRLLVPDVEDVVGHPLAVGFLKADALPDPRHGNGFQAKDRLMGLVLDFDLDHDCAGSR